MRNLILLTLMMLLSTSTLAKSCFANHLTDAIEVNKERRKLYRKLTDGKSWIISTMLINSELLSVPTAKKFDKKAEKFQKLGAPFLCADFIEMYHAPSFEPYITPVNSKDEFLRVDPSRTGKVTKFLLRAKMFSSLERFLLKEFNKVKKVPTFHCMYRHVLESIIRSLRLNKMYKEILNPKDYRELTKLTVKFLKAQSLAFPFSETIDKMAKNIQAKGVPIICNDIPVIDINPTVNDL